MGKLRHPRLQQETAPSAAAANPSSCLGRHRQGPSAHRVSVACSNSNCRQRLQLAATPTTSNISSLRSSSNSSSCPTLVWRVCVAPCGCCSGTWTWREGRTRCGSGGGRGGPGAAGGEGGEDQVREGFVRHVRSACCYLGGATGNTRVCSGVPVGVLLHGGKGLRTLMWA